MTKSYDIIAIFFLCLAMLIVSGPEHLSVVGFLCAVVVVCLSQVLPHPWTVIVEWAFYALTLVLPPALFFLAPVVYIAMYERNWGFRLSWIVVFVAALWMPAVRFDVLVALLLTCSASMLLAIHSIRGEADRKGLLFANNTLREENLALAKQHAEAVSHANDQSDTVGLSSQTNGAANQRGQSSGKTNFEQEKFADLSPRELAIVRLIADGMDNKQIASELFLSEGTVRNHVSAILAKKNLSHRTQIAVAYYRGD